MCANEVKCILCDIDGTLAGSDNRLSINNAKAIALANKNGIPFIPATGRSIIGFKSLMDDDRISDIVQHPGYPGIFFNGAIAVGNKGPNDYILRQLLCDKTLIEVCKYLNNYKIKLSKDDEGYMEGNGDHQERHAAYCIYFLNSFVHEEKSIQLHNAEALSHEFSIRIPDTISHINNNPNSAIKMVISEENHILKDIRSHLDVLLNGKEARVVFSLFTMLEVLPKQCSKGFAATKLLDSLGISPASTMALGDAENDIEMLKLCNCSIAVGNACEKTKQFSKHSVAPNSQDGVAEAIYKFCNLK